MAGTLSALYRANLGILSQKLELIGVLKSTFGDARANELFRRTCPVVAASVGQHIRHSMDHLELATTVAADCLRANGPSPADPPGETLRELHYDLRNRGGEDEHDIEAARIRIENTSRRIMDLSTDPWPSSPARPVQACFMLSADPREFYLPSTVERELGFAAHHAIHHMAMVRIIALQTLQIPAEALAPDFGRAPSTIVFDDQHQQ